MSHDPIREKCVCSVKPSDLCSVHSDEALMKKSAEIERIKNLNHGQYELNERVIKERDDLKKEIEEWKSNFGKSQLEVMEHQGTIADLQEKLKQAEHQLSNVGLAVYGSDAAVLGKIQALESQVKTLTEEKNPECDKCCNGTEAEVHFCVPCYESITQKHDPIREKWSLAGGKDKCGVCGAILDSDYADLQKERDSLTQKLDKASDALNYYANPTKDGWCNNPMIAKQALNQIGGVE